MGRREKPPREHSGPCALSVEGLVAGYGKAVIVNAVDIHVDAGDFVALLGPNGAGKSTVLKAVAGLVVPSGGSVRLHGEEMAAEPPEKLVAAGLSYVPQLRDVFLGMTVLDNLKLGGYLLRRRQRALRIDEMLEIFPPLRDKLGDKAAQLSGGQQRMLGVARALMNGPRVLLLDEPTAGLSPKLAGELMEHLVSINRLGIDLLMVEQNAEAALAACNRVYVLANGSTEFEGSADQLRAHSGMSQIYLG